MFVPATTRQYNDLPRFALLPNVPPSIMLLTSVVAGASVVVGSLAGLPLWAIAIAGVVPWVPVFSHETIWTWRNYGWLALFYVLAVSQTGHFAEHLAQMVQIHVLGRTGQDARGVVSTLDVEWVHLVWNGWVVFAAGVLVARFRTNRWLWLATAIAIWHLIEHVYIMALYLDGGPAGAPGLLADGGRIGGGLPLTRPDLHFIYNAIETAPLIAAFVIQLRRSRTGHMKGVAMS